MQGVRGNLRNLKTLPNHADPRSSNQSLTSIKFRAQGSGLDMCYIGIVEKKVEAIKCNPGTI